MWYSRFVTQAIHIDKRLRARVYKNWMVDFWGGDEYLVKHKETKSHIKGHVWLQLFIPMFDIILNMAVYLDAGRGWVCKRSCQFCDIFGAILDIMRMCLPRTICSAMYIPLLKKHCYIFLSAGFNSQSLFIISAQLDHLQTHITFMNFRLVWLYGSYDFKSSWIDETAQKLERERERGIGEGGTVILFQIS